MSVVRQETNVQAAVDSLMTTSMQVAASTCLLRAVSTRAKTNARLMVTDRSAAVNQRSLSARFLVVGVFVSLLCACVLTGCSSALKAEKEPEVAAVVVEKISPEEAHDLIGSENVVLLDVRTSGEYADAHIPHATLLPLDAIDADTAAAVAPAKDATLLVYCRSGVRSAEAARILVELGYIHVLDLGGIQSWPFETESGSEG